MVLHGIWKFSSMLTISNFDTSNLEILYFCVDQLYGIDNINNQKFLNQNLHDIVRRQTRGLKFSCKKIFIFHFNNTESKYTFRRHEQHGGSVALMTLSSEIAITYKININSILHYMLIVYNFKCYCKLNVLIEYFEKNHTT